MVQSTPFLTLQQVRHHPLMMDLNEGRALDYTTVYRATVPRFGWLGHVLRVEMFGRLGERPVRLVRKAEVAEFYRRVKQLGVARRGQKWAARMRRKQAAMA